MQLCESGEVVMYQSEKLFCKDNYRGRTRNRNVIAHVYYALMQSLKTTLKGGCVCRISLTSAQSFNSIFIHLIE